MEYQRFEETVRSSLETARVSLAALTGRNPALDQVDMAFIELKALPLLAGDPELPVLASYVTFGGDAEGQLLILFRPDSIETIADYLPAEALRGLTPDETPSMVESILLEIANVVGSSVLNAVADGSGLRISPTPPVLVRDMAGAILGSALAYTGDRNTLYVAHIKYTLSGGKASFDIVILPKVSSDLDKFMGDGMGQWRAS